MSKRTRTFLFLFCLILFITVTPITLLYSEGWRFDFANNEIVKTGGLSVKIRPRVRADVYLNGNFKKKVNRWTYSAFLKGLTPRRHVVKIDREDYHPWSKTLKVNQEEVTEARRVLLIPEQPQLNPELEQVENYFRSPDGTRILYQNQAGLHLYNSNQDRTEKVYSEKPTITDLKWGPELERVLIQTPQQYLILNFTDSQAEQIELNPSRVSQIDFHPQQSDYLLFVQDRSLLEFKYNSTSSEPEKIISGLVESGVSQREITWISEQGELLQSDFSGELQSILARQVPHQDTTKLLKRGGQILILDDQMLYGPKPDRKEFKKIASAVKRVKVSPDTQKALLISDYELSVIYLVKQYSQPRQEKYDQVFLTRFSSPIESVLWLGSHHLIFDLERNNQIKISEIDARDKINTVNYLNSEFERMDYNQNKNEFYLLKDKTLSQTSLPSF